MPNSQIYEYFAKLPKKQNSPRSSNSWTRRDSNSWKTEEPIAYCPQPTPIHKLSMMSMVWNISIGQLCCLSGYASS